MNAHIDWMKHAALLDQQPSNRRLVQENPTTRWQSPDMVRLRWSDQVEHGACIAGLIVWAASVAVLLYTLWGNP